MRLRTYFFVVLSVLLLLIVSVVAVNALVDPLDVYRVVRKEGFNWFKPSYIPYARLAKPSQIERGQYDRLGIGSSRMLMGIPVANAAWAQYGKGFNAGIQGADLVQIHDLFEHAVVVSHVKSVVIDLDLFMFNAWMPSGEYPYPVARLNETPRERVVRERDTAMLLLFSPGVTLASVDTLRKQDGSRGKVTIDGTTNPEKEQRQVLEDGYEVRFRQFEDRMARSGWSICSDNRYAFVRGKINKMNVFRDILQIAKAHNVEVKFFIPPLHVRLQEVMQAAGLDPYSDEMKRRLLAEIFAVYGDHAQSVALWDFSGYHHYAQEVVPQQAGVPMQWYLDASHFSQALGQKMLDVMFAAPHAEKDFGVQLSAGNLDAVLAAQHAEQRAFQQTHSAMSRDLHERAAAVLRDKQINGIACGKTE
ncbi:MAG TPA: hypothetical protein PLH12_01900 [Pseudomonadales bacterium]|nr:hypothetical protein [Pseudomonadales bacterium]